MQWRLGLDIGTNSLGWWAFELADSPTGMTVLRSLDGGARIFHDGREPGKAGRVGDSRAVARRQSRGMRRNRDRGRHRQAELIRELIALALLPGDRQCRDALFQTPKTTDLTARNASNPYHLRDLALREVLTPHQLGRVLAHLGKRRGYKSNRKESSDDDGGKLKEKIDAFTSELGDRTLGQYIWQSHHAEVRQEKSASAQGPRSNARAVRFTEDSPYRPTREHYEKEFDRIREVQAAHHQLTAKDWDRLRDRFILFQWPLKEVERGACEFFADEPRHWVDTPIGHDFRLYQEVNNLRWISDATQQAHNLTMAQRQAVIDKLLSQKSEVPFKTLRKLKGADKQLLFPSDSLFNLESEKRKGLKPHKLAVRLAENPLLAPLWQAREQNNDDFLDRVFEWLFTAEDDAQALEKLQRSTAEDGFGLSLAQAEALCAIKLGRQTASVSRKFMEDIVPVLRDQGLTYSDAVAELRDAAGNPLHHSLRDDKRRWPQLPYYGEVIPQAMLGKDPKKHPTDDPEGHFGRINNPTVHVALNQVRKLVNCLTERFGSAPAEIHIELSRDLKLSRKRRDEETSLQAANQRKNEGLRKSFEELGYQQISARDLRKARLWEELGQDTLARRCVYSGRPISHSQLLNGEAEIEHILPFSRTLDDGLANQTLSLRWVNRLKGNKTPYEAFGADQHKDKGIVWEEVMARAQRLPKQKRARFAAKAMENYEKDGGFIQRQMTDTAYMARTCARYLRGLEGVQRIVTVPGRLTALVRGKWQLNRLLHDHNRKNREDHRHHAIDAAVIALTTRSLLESISRDSGRGSDDQLHLQVQDISDALHEQLEQRIQTMLVSFKPDHGVQGRFFKETAYGFVEEDKRDPDLPKHGLVVRKPLTSLSPKEVSAIRDPGLRRKLASYLNDGPGQGVKLDKALVGFGQQEGVKRVRILVTEQTVKPVKSAPYKGYAPDAYLCCDIWQVPDGKPGKWKKGETKYQGVFWSYLEAAGAQPDKLQRQPHPAARFICRVFKHDQVAYFEEGAWQFRRVAGFSTTNNRLDLREINKPEPDQQYRSINTLGGLQLHRISLSPDGRLRKFRGQIA